MCGRPCCDTLMACLMADYAPLRSLLPRGGVDRCEVHTCREKARKREISAILCDFEEVPS